LADSSKGSSVEMQRAGKPSSTHSQNEKPDWLLDRIKTLEGYNEKARDLLKQTGEVYEVGPQAVLKLSILAYYLDVYTQIIKKRFPKSYFLDLFASSGINKIENTDEVILGSPLIAEYIPDKKFDKLILFESKEARAKALQKLLPKAKVVHGDVNALDLTNYFKDEEGKIVPLFCFADPEGMELDWSTMTQVLKTWSDVMINYHPDAVRRTAGRAFKKDKPYEDRMNSFFGTDHWKLFQTFESDDAFLNLYISQIRQFKEMVIPIRVRGQKSYYYYIIFAVKKTNGTQGWIDAIERAKKHIESSDASRTLTTIDIQQGKQQTLSFD